MGLQPVSPDRCRFVCVHRTLDDSRCSDFWARLPSVHTWEICNLCSAPYPGRETERPPCGAWVEGTRRKGWLDGRVAQRDGGSCLPQCTASCGGGMQTRSVQCLAGGRPAAGCSVLQKPTVSQACNTRFCPIAEKKGECRGPPPSPAWV